ncbi:putative E3 ubiquitin-protein ligase [Tetrabaena socialis]|uniref:Putative E3 ubiquitin-protein ligase n=1 Tax=Tetrabaena socialis TaxID=47790 RepID=A0A2J8A539_9CHLO|nr:putative E3 ubiquitin-protein ligase [Tetrabaena socialis]|eukprot:PNH07652.1 putative E3 ubiquitin-protein ligase [Tetrabaena socialis]
MGISYSCTSKGALLLVAAANGDLVTAQELLAKHPKAASYYNFKDRSSPLLQAGARGHFELVQLILETAVMTEGPERAKKNCIDHANSKRQTALMVACKHGHPDCVEYLVTNGGDPLLTDERRHNTCLHFAALYGHSECVHKLLNSRAAYRVQGRQVPVAQIPCADDGVKFIDRHNGWGLSALHIAVFQGSVSTVRALLRHGADMESIISASKVENSPIRCAVGSNALHIAALTGNIIMAKLILETQALMGNIIMAMLILETQMGWLVVAAAAGAAAAAAAAADTGDAATNSTTAAGDPATTTTNMLRALSSRRGDAVQDVVTSGAGGGLPALAASRSDSGVSTPVAGRAAAAARDAGGFGGAAGDAAGLVDAHSGGHGAARVLGAGAMGSGGSGGGIELNEIIPLVSSGVLPRSGGGPVSAAAPLAPAPTAAAPARSGGGAGARGAHPTSAAAGKRGAGSGGGDAGKEGGGGDGGLDGQDDSPAASESGSEWSDDDRNVCSICMDLPVAVLVAGCQHGLCVQCAFQLCVKGRELPSCPFCRQKIGGFEAKEAPGAGGGLGRSPAPSAATAASGGRA